MAKRVVDNDTSNYTVHGTVTGLQGEPLEHSTVTVWWQRIRERRRLSEGRTSEDGTYRISYRLPDDTRTKVLIIVEARSPHLEAALESPATVAEADLTINLAAVPHDRSEWAELLRAVRPLLDTLDLDDLVENSEFHDISFLAQETGRTKEQITRLTIAARLAEAYRIPAQAFFAFLRQQIPTSLPSPLLDATDGFTLIHGLVQRIASLIFALTPDVQTSALHTAVSRNFIGRRDERKIPEIVAELQKYRVTDLLGRSYLVGKTTLGQLLGVADVAEAKQQAFATALITNTTSMAKFWRTLGDGTHGFSEAEAASIERTLSIGVLVKNHVPLIQLLQQRFQTGASAQLSDLARLTLKDWEGLIARSGAPSTIDAAGNVTANEAYAQGVYSRVTRAYPTVALASRVVTGDLVPAPQQAPLNRFFTQNSDLNLLRHNVGAYLHEQGDKVFTGIAQEDRAAVLTNVKRLQRVLFVTPEVDAAEALLAQGLHSATQVAIMGRQQFFHAATTAGISKRDANRIYSTATQRYAGMVALYTQLNRDAIGVWPKAIGDVSGLDQPISGAVARDQSLSALFGSQDYCAVDSCTSILSPAAYLCDLLYWLRYRRTGAQSALDVLNGRRPDIGNLQLNCPNTETPLPYIDLVNELLSDAISPPTDPNSTINPPWKQTTDGKIAADLRAAPEYFNAGAFAALFGANYPHSLPYSEGLDELRAYLQSSGLALWQLRKALLPLHSPTTPQQLAVAAERFALAPHAVDIVTNADFLATADAWPPLPLPATIEQVPSFTHTASITYDQLFELLQSAWVQNGLGVAVQGIDDTCNTGTQALAPAPLDPAFLDRAHRFLRLWRTTGYQMWELDLLMQSAAAVSGTLNANGLIALGAFRMLQDVTGLAADAQLAWFQPMDIAAHRGPNDTTTPPLYSRVFLNPAIVSLHPDADIAAIPAGSAIADNNLSHHLDALQASLGISGTDAGALAALFGLDAPGTLTLDNLSLLYRVTAFATIAKTSLADLQRVAWLITPGAANTAASITALLGSVAAATSALQQIKAIQQSGLSIDALTYLLTPPAATPPYWTATSAITDTAIGTALGAVRQAILSPSGGDVNGSVIAAVASQLTMANDVTAFILQTFTLPGTATTLLTVLTDAAITGPAGGPYPDCTRASYPDQFVALQLADKARVIVQKLHLVSADLSWLVTNAATYGGLDFTQLPVTNAQAALGVAPLLSTVLLVKLARLFTAAPPASPITSLYDVIAGVHTGTLVNEAAAQAALSTITGWTLADIVALTAALDVTFGADYLLPATYDQLRTLAAMIAATSGHATGAQLVAWAGVPADEPAAEALAASALSTLKARYSNPDWLSAAPDIMNPLREHRAAALQDYLVGNGDHAGHAFADLNALFDYFLIDTQMSSCEVTTRVIQAYVAVQIFVERCRMNLEAPTVQIDPSDDAWEWWSWMKRYRIWEAAREVFLYPENWLIESQRPSRTEIYKKLEQDVHQGEHTTDNFETVSLTYIDGLDDVAHLYVTGTCQDPATKAIHVVGRSHSDPPRFYHRVLQNGEWSGWERVPLDIKSQHVVPAVYRNRVCLFWPEIKVHNEPHQNLPAAQPSTSAPSQDADKYVSIALFFTIFRNGSWAPAQTSKGKLFDIPILTSQSASDSRSVEALYTLKVQSPLPDPLYGASLFVDVFRLGDYEVLAFFLTDIPFENNPDAAVHVGRAVFDGRYEDLELNNLEIAIQGAADHLLAHAQNAYGPDAHHLLPLPTPDPDLVGEPGTVPKAGALATRPPNPFLGNNQTLPLTFTAIPLEQNAGTLLQTARVPFRVIGPSSNLAFDPTTYFFYQDGRRCYFVDTQRWYWTASTWSPNPPSNPTNVPFEARYFFHRFYHPYTRLLWHQLGSAGFPGIYNNALQENPDQVDPSHADVFSFQSTYQPVVPRVAWGEDNEILDFSSSAAYSVYNWEVFYHIPLYIAGLLSQNQQFEDATKWFHYIFDPTRQGPDSVPQRFWIPKPLHDLTSAAILQERINNLLLLVNQGDADALLQVRRWRDDPFNPFLLADLRPVAYMKTVVMQYLDNLIAWADNLFASDSREALSEATLLYVIASEILGPKPAAITPPDHADDSYNDLAPKLDAFANAMVDIENVMGGGGGGMGGGGGGMGGGGGNMPPPQTFYFKIPPNEKLLGYWDTVDNRLFKLRHCQNIQGVTRALALFDAPIDPGLLVKARAAGLDPGSVLKDVAASLPSYRYTALYTQALDFVNALRAYGASLIGALEKSDGAALATLQQTIQMDIQHDMDQIFQWQIDKVQHDLEALQQALAIAQSRYDFNHSQPYMIAAEWVDFGLGATIIVFDGIAFVAELVAAGLHNLPDFALGVSGFGGTPAATASEGGPHFGSAAQAAADAGKTMATLFDKSAALARSQASYMHRKDNWDQAAREADLQKQQTQASILSNEVLLSIAKQNQINHQNQIDYIQKQIDFLTNKFTNQDLYDWQVGQLADTYFQSYKLAYRMCKLAEKCYQYELGIMDSNFIQFGYWDSLHKGLLAGETLNHDLRRMQSSYLDENKRRFELSRYVSLAAIDPTALRQLLTNGVCDFDLLESLFDGDYPGHYNRHLLRVSVTVVYPSPGKFDNVKATLTLVANKVRVATTASSSADYPETGPGDPRFLYNYGAVAQKIALGNAQDDPGLFQTALSSNLSDQRYLPFEGAGAISSWRLEMTEAANEVDLSSVGDVVLHLYYTALDGGDALKGFVTQNNIDNLPTTGLRVFSARNDFAASPATVANPYPQSPWDAFLTKPAPADPDQSLVLTISPLKFPQWTRGKTLTVTGIQVLTVGWPTGTFTLEPQAPLTQMPADMTMSPIAGSTEPNICGAVLTVPPNTPPGKWTFKLKTSDAADFRSLTKNDIGDLLLLVTFTAS